MPVIEEEPANGIGMLDLDMSQLTDETPNVGAQHSSCPVHPGNDEYVLQPLHR